MTYNTSPIQINPDPRFLTIVVIGTPTNVETDICEQHLRGYAKVYEWSKPQPATDRAPLERFSWWQPPLTPWYRID